MNSDVKRAGMRADWVSIKKQILRWVTPYAYTDVRMLAICRKVATPCHFFEGQARLSGGEARSANYCGKMRSDKKHGRRATRITMCHEEMAEMAVLSRPLFTMPVWEKSGEW
jgi:hypothetical protein